MKTLLAALLAIAVFLPGCALFDKVQKQQKAQMQRVLTERLEARNQSQDERASKIRRTPVYSQFKYVRLIRQIDYSGCPEDFRTAWVSYVQACENANRSDLPGFLAFAGAIVAPNPVTIAAAAQSMASDTRASDLHKATQHLELVCAHYDLKFAP